MEKPPELYVIREPETPAEHKVLHLPIRSHEGPVEHRAVEPPWLRQSEWRNLVRRLVKNPVKT